MASGEPLEHLVRSADERDAFERQHQVTWCRRCGRMIANDRFPENVTSKPCQVVRVALRSRFGSTTSLSPLAAKAPL